jgi:hypothetical protein
MLSSLSLLSGDVFESMNNAVSKGDFKTISTFFGSTVDITILTQEDVYSNIQAEQIIKDFFLKNPPKSFRVIHKGSSNENIAFTIGKYQSKHGKVFRISYLFKNNGGNFVLKEFRCENE